jgi:hypothetical protein
MRGCHSERRQLRHSERAKLLLVIPSERSSPRHSERAQRVEESRSSRSRGSSRRGGASRFRRATCFTQRRRERQRRRGPLAPAHDPTNQLTALCGSASSRSMRPGLAPYSASPQLRVISRSQEQLQRQRHFRRSRGAAGMLSGSRSLHSGQLLSIHDPKSRISRLGIQPLLTPRSLSVGLCASADRGGRSHLGPRLCASA